MMLFVCVCTHSSMNNVLELIFSLPCSPGDGAPDITLGSKHLPAESPRQPHKEFSGSKINPLLNVVLKTLVGTLYYLEKFPMLARSLNEHLNS